MVTVADLQQDGLAVFRHVKHPSRVLTAAPLYAGLQSIYVNMANENFVKAGIAKLEDLLWKELKWRYDRTALETDPVKSDDQLKTEFKTYYDNSKAGTHDPARKTANINKALLTEILETTENAYGFGEVSYAWGTSAKAFLNNLKARRPFKDYGASKDHGDNTHRVQWFIICRELFNGVKDAAKYYEETAYWTCELQQGSETHTIYLWDMLCDNASNTTGFTKNEAKGRSPIYVMDLLRSADYPMLSAFCDYRRAKDFASDIKQYDIPDGARESYKNKGVIPKTLDRAAWRFKGQSFMSLSEKERAKLVKTLGKHGFLDA